MFASRQWYSSYFFSFLCVFTHILSTNWNRKNVHVGISDTDRTARVTAAATEDATIDSVKLQTNPTRFKLAGLL